jgi:putative inorganic carbon (HCO3(-)) transporter
MTVAELYNKSEKLSPSFFLFLFYIVVWWLQLGERLGKRFGTEIRLEAVVVVILLAITLADSFRRKLEEKAGFAPYILALFSVMIIQVVFAWFPDRAWDVFTGTVLKYSAMGLLIARFVRTPRQLGWLMFVWLLACWKGTLEGVIGGITGSLIWENQGIMRLNGVGLWAHPNSFSEFALGVIPFCFYLFPLVNKRWLQLGLISLFCFATYVVIYTASRTGYLGYIAMLILFYFQSPQKVRKSLLIVLMILIPITVYYLPQDYKARFMSSFSGEEKEGHSKESRIKLYKEGWYIFTHHPLGVGVQNFREVAYIYFKDPMDQHCLYTEVLTELGIQGFIVFLILLRKIYTSLNSTRNELLALVARVGKSVSDDTSLIYDVRLTHAIVQSTLVYFLLRLFLDIFGMDLYGICWWFIIGIASSTFFIMNNLRSQMALRDLANAKIPFIISSSLAKEGEHEDIDS